MERGDSSSGVSSFVTKMKCKMRCLQMADSKNESKVIMMLLTKQVLPIFFLITLMTSHIFTIPPNLSITKFKIVKRMWEIFLCNLWHELFEISYKDVQADIIYIHNQSIKCYHISEADFTPTVMKRISGLQYLLLSNT
jgi:hypothetical protein